MIPQSGIFKNYIKSWSIVRNEIGEIDPVVKVFKAQKLTK
ncbi:MAG: hypothetical protein ACJAYD_000044 [Patiriisocius sp.]|jgi:hypothetical protein